MQNHLFTVQAQFAGSSSSSVKLFMEMPIYSTLQVEVEFWTKNNPQKSTWVAHFLPNASHI